jgi:hypothetical protein
MDGEAPPLMETGSGNIHNVSAGQKANFCGSAVRYSAVGYSLFSFTRKTRSGEEKLFMVSGCPEGT